MEISIEEVVELRQRFAAGYADPPQAVIQAVAAVVGKREITDSVVHRDRTERDTTWRCMALAGGCLITVEASHPGDWYRGSFDDEEAEGADIRASVIALAEVAACYLVGLRSMSDTTWVGKWELRLRDGDTLTIPYPDHRSGHKSHDVLGSAIAAQIQ